MFKQPIESAIYTSHPTTHVALEGLMDVASSLTEELLALQEVRQSQLLGPPRCLPSVARDAQTTAHVGFTCPGSIAPQ